ncbi:transposon-encoded TnpW family protein [Lacrimispora saccharolytica]|uniref:transposon-encoded TnpW family protein n=1 Tax=Lacrimispora saccharolytica TaxID=84030 RepID=UPI00265D11B1|nr:transposon-encoded TnpW family protein [Lacrimispora saccharolytica]MCF2657336.1 transposon-encoded TnpW family protein [Lacrimispora saccharolytica]
MENEKNITTDTNIVGTEGTTHSDPTSVVSRTIGKTTYVANLHFKEQGQTFSQKLKRVLKADAGC